MLQHLPFPAAPLLPPRTAMQLAFMPAEVFTAAPALPSSAAPHPTRKPTSLKAEVLAAMPGTSYSAPPPPNLHAASPSCKLKSSVALAPARA